MKNRFPPSWRRRPLAPVVLAVACLGVWSVAFTATPAEAGSVVIPAWAFARGNVEIHADPDKYADAGPVVVSGPRKPWGWTVEYDVVLPVDGGYTLSICYASGESRPVQVFCDNRNLAKTCNRISLAPASSQKPNSPTWKSSGARWEVLRNRFGRPIGPSKAGKHTVILTRRGPLPHLVALRLDTQAPFPADWQPPRYKVRNLDRVPAKYHKAFAPPSGVDVAALRLPAKNTPEPKAAASLQVHAWTFDRGNARIYASPDLYANAGPVVGSELGYSGEGSIEYDIDFPVDGEYTLHVSYTSAEARPVEVSVGGKFMGMACIGATYDSAPKEQPIVFTSNSSGTPKRGESLSMEGKPATMTVTKGKQTLRFFRRGPLPNLITFRLGSLKGVPGGWKAPRRKVRHLDKVVARDRTTFLPLDAVNLDALREAIEDTIKTYGPQYPDGKKYLERLAKFEKQQHELLALPGGGGPRTVRVWAAEKDKPEKDRTIEAELAALRREAMLAHPALGFDKLLFIKRKPEGGHIYEGHMQRNNRLGSSLCVLSPVSPDGKVTEVAPELSGGIFSRFDLSFDGKRVVFGYRKPDTPFQIYEMDIDPSTGLGVKGSLRQLTGVTEGAKGAPQKGVKTEYCSFNDTDPVYLPNGKIMFVSSRSRRNVFCFPATVTSLYVMDADGKNIRRLSSGPLTEMGPSLLDDGRVAYTRWEYVDKGLGNGQGLWTVRPDGSGNDHLYKNSIMRPSGMLSPRSIPGSQRFVTAGCSHMERGGGPVILVDTRITKRSTEAMTCITPEIGYPCMYRARWGMGIFLDPYPFSEKFFLVSHFPGGDAKKVKYGIYALDAWGNRAKLYGDPKIGCFLPFPLRPRRKPMQIVATKPGGAKEKEGTIFMQDVYEGMTGIERGRVKYLRVMGVLPWPSNENGMFRIGGSGNVHRKKVYGVAKVHEDGSALFKVPPGENIFFQALDENFMLLQHMPTFINVMPGEYRSCIGCHEHRSKAPATARALPLAMKYPAQALAPQPGDTGPRMIHYASDVQPVLDKHCVGCHIGPNPKARLDLTGVPTETWNRSYENILGRGLVGARDCAFGRSGYRPAPPLTFGSGISRLAERLRKDPCKANISREQFIKIVTWIDANTPYYGTYRGKRELKDKDEPDFRLPPLAGK